MEIMPVKKLSGSFRSLEAVMSNDEESIRGSRHASPWMYMIQVPKRAGTYSDSMSSSSALRLLGIQTSRVCRAVPLVSYGTRPLRQADVVATHGVEDQEGAAIV